MRRGARVAPSPTTSVHMCRHYSRRASTPRAESPEANRNEESKGTPTGRSKDHPSATVARPSRQRRASRTRATRVSPAPRNSPTPRVSSTGFLSTPQARGRRGLPREGKNKLCCFFPIFFSSRLIFLFSFSLKRRTADYVVLGIQVPFLRQRGRRRCRGAVGDLYRAGIHEQSGKLLCPPGEAESERRPGHLPSRQG